MSETEPAAPPPRTPLYELLSEGRVAFGEVDGWEMPRVYENIKMEYLAAKGTVALIDRSHRGRLRVTGAKRFDLLNRLTTNDLRDIPPGGGARTAMLTAKGRIIDDLLLYAREDSFILVTSPGNGVRVREAIEKLRFRDDVTVEDETRGTAMIALVGPQSAHLLEAVAPAAARAGLALHHSVETQVSGARLLAARIDDLGGHGYHLISGAAEAPAIWSALLARGGPYGASPCGEEAWEMLRIEGGIPRFGRELTQEHNPLEARLDASINWKKGCYVGQEVVARLDSRQKISKLLVGLWLEPGPVPEAGSPIEAADRPGSPIGSLTSVAPSLDFRRVIGLGYVRTDHAAPGSRVVVASPDDRVPAEVSDLPFRPPGAAGGE